MSSASLTSRIAAAADADALLETMAQAMQASIVEDEALQAAAALEGRSPYLAVAVLSAATGAPARAERWFLLGRMRESAGESALARAAYRRCVALEGGHERALAALSKLPDDGGGLRPGRDDGASHPAQRAASDPPPESLGLAADRVRQDADLAHALELTRLGEYETALPVWRTLTQVARHRETAILAVAGCLFELKRYPEAERAYRGLCRIGNTSVEARVGLARCLAAQSSADAPSAWLAVLDLDPDHGEALQGLARAPARPPAQAGHSSEPQERETRPKLSADRIVLRALQLETDERVEEAEHLLRTVAVLRPAAEQPLRALAKFLARQMRWDEALAQADRWLAFAPQSLEALQLRIEIVEKLGRAADIEAAYRDVLAQHPDDDKALLGLARICRERGALDEALALWRRAAAVSPNAAEPWRRIVASLANADREDEALAEFANARAALGDGAEATLVCADILDAARFLDRVPAAYEAAIARLPTDPRPRRNLARSLAREGYLAPALVRYAEAQRLAPHSAGLAREAAGLAETAALLEFDPRTASLDPAASPLLPEVLFERVRRLAQNEITPYEPVPGRIALASQSLGPGGSERQLAATARGLMGAVGAIESVWVLCRSLDPKTQRDFYRAEIEESGAKVVAPNEAERVAALDDPALAPYRRLIEAFPADMGPLGYWVAWLQHHRPAVVHAWQDVTALTFGVAALLAGVPRILLSARSVRPDNPRRRFRRWMREGYRQLLAVDRVTLINNSAAGSADYADWLGLPPDAIAVVHNGIDLERLSRERDPDASARMRQELGVPAQAPVVGGVFRFSEEKRPLLWMETARRVAAERPDARFVLCGDGPMMPMVRAYTAEHGLAGRMHLAGVRDRIAVWFGLMDAVLLTSRHEGLPNVLIEAQALGVPVVVADVGGAAEALVDGETGFAVRDATAASLAAKVLACLADTPWRRHAQAAAPAFAQRTFSLDAMVSGTLRHYGLAEQP